LLNNPPPDPNVDPNADPNADPNVKPAPANENDPKEKPGFPKVHVSVKTSDAAGMIRRVRRRVRRLMAYAPVRGESVSAKEGGSNAE
jgi:hypothetical protein